MTNPSISYSLDSRMAPERQLFSVTVQDVQNEALLRIGRFLNEDEINGVKDGLEWGIGESLGCVYDAIFARSLLS